MHEVAIAYEEELCHNRSEEIDHEGNCERGRQKRDAQTVETRSHPGPVGGNQRRDKKESDHEVVEEAVRVQHESETRLLLSRGCEGVEGPQVVEIELALNIVAPKGLRRLESEEVLTRSLGDPDFIWVCSIELCIGVLVAFLQRSGAIELFREREAPVDAFGVGSAISGAPPIDFTADIKEIEGRPVAKRGRIPGLTHNARLKRTAL